MASDTALIQAYLTNVQMALQNLDVEHAQTLLERVQELIKEVPSAPTHLTLSFGVGMDVGIERKGGPNEDAAFAATGTNVKSGDTYGLFVVCDGMGGHKNGREASRLGVQTIVDAMIPVLAYEEVDVSDLGKYLECVVYHASNLIYNASDSDMGTTATVAVVFGPHAFIANVGDSRTYLYRPGVGLRQITRDHSFVSNLVESGQITPEQVYTHPQRNLIYRSLGGKSVEVDVFAERLQDGDVLLLCSDGMWEMARDSLIERILGAGSSAEQMAEQLVALAIQGGGHDNISLAVCQVSMDCMNMPTMLLSPVAVPTIAVRY